MPQESNITPEQFHTHMEGIAQELNCTTQFRPKTHWDYGQRAIFTLNTDKPQTIQKFGISLINMKAGRCKVYGLYPNSSSGLEQVSDHHSPVMMFNMISKNPAAATKDIKRRFWADWLKAWEEMQKKCIAADAFHNQRANALAEACTILGCKPTPHGDPGFTRYAYASEASVSIRSECITPTSMSLHLDMPKDIALKLFQWIKDNGY